MMRSSLKSMRRMSKMSLMNRRRRFMNMRSKLSITGEKSSRRPFPLMSMRRSSSWQRRSRRSRSVLREMQWHNVYLFNHLNIVGELIQIQENLEQSTMDAQ
jgi:hypothetical protein